MVVDQTFEGGARLGGKKTKHGKPSTFERGLHIQTMLK
jgi:hypothetical protein